MPLLVMPLRLPADVAELRAADVDQDGRDELIAVAQVRSAGQPDAVTLTVMHFDASGREEARQTLDLGREPLLWDADHGGLYAIDGAGVVRLALDGTRPRLASLPTPLAPLGRTTPSPADIAHDLDGDGDAEVLVWSRGRYHAVASHGGVYGSVPAPARGDLGARDQAGGAGLRVTAALPPLVVGDIDGDGRADLSLPQGDRLTVFFTGDELGARTARLRLPRDLDPPPPRGEGDGPRVRLISSWFSDMDGDGRIDLVTHDAVTDGSWFGSTAALTVYPGTGGGFGPPQRAQTEAAAFDVRVVDWEGDGDQDLVVPQVDVSMGNLARGLLSRSVQVEAMLYRMTDGRLSSTPERLGELVVPLERPDRFHARLTSDLTGDGVIDLVTDGGEDRLEVFAGRPDPSRGRGIEEAPIGAVDLVVPDVEDALMVRDLTGDGRAEIVVWSPGSAQATMVRVDP